MKRHIARAALAAALLSSGVASAGWRSSGSVWVDKTYRQAGGSLGTARNSSDTVQAIGCWVMSTGLGACYAYRSDWVSASCYTRAPEMLSLIQAITSDSSVRFDWDTSGNCTLVDVLNGSQTEPKR